jgi:hypothetical protein
LSKVVIVLRTSATLSSSSSLLLACLAVVACSEGTTGLVLGGRSGDLGGAPSTDTGGTESASGGAAGSTSGGSPSTDGWWEATCAPTVTFENQDSSADGAAIEAALGDPGALVQSGAQDVCRILYKSAAEVPTVDSVHLLLQATPDAGAIGGSQVRLSTTHLTNIQNEGGSATGEAAGMMRFFLSHMYMHSVDQTPGWLVSGKADFVRHSAGYLDLSDRPSGGTWTDGFRTTAFFLAYLDDLHVDFVYTLNQRMAPGEPPYSDDLFQDLTGTPLPTLWDEYQATLP